MIQIFSRADYSDKRLNQSCGKQRDRDGSSDVNCVSDKSNSMNHGEKKRNCNEVSDVLICVKSDRRTKKRPSDTKMDSKNLSHVRNTESSSDGLNHQHERPLDWWTRLERVTTMAGVTLTRVRERCDRWD